MYHTHLTYLKAWIIATQEGKIVWNSTFPEFSLFPTIV